MPHNSPPDGYALVWADEFLADGLPDPAWWTWDTHANKAGWYNHERQYYADCRPENAHVGHGRLVITARKEALASAPDWGGQEYTSARLTTQGNAEWTCGFVQVRARLPGGAGTWPAIWMLGTGGDWPLCGEIDIMEQVGRAPTTVLGTVHTASTAGTAGDSGRVDIPDACAAFHDYQVLWTPDRLSFGVDGRVFHTYDNRHVGKEQWPFDAPHYLLLNIAVGGDLGGPIDDTIFPVWMEVEHVRVFQPR